MSLIQADQSIVDVIGGSNDFKPGQKYPTPSPGNGDRVFYETLIEQLPNSEMAQEWCVAYGILDYKIALQVHTLICKRKGKPIIANPSPIKKVVESNNNKNNNNTNQQATQNRKRKVKIDDDVVGETGFDPSSGWEGMGTYGI